MKVALVAAGVLGFVSLAVTVRAHDESAGAPSAGSAMEGISQRDSARRIAELLEQRRAGASRSGKACPRTKAACSGAGSAACEARQGKVARKACCSGGKGRAGSADSRSGSNKAGCCSGGAADKKAGNAGCCGNKRAGSGSSASAKCSARGQPCCGGKGKTS